VRECVGEDLVQLIILRQVLGDHTLMTTPRSIWYSKHCGLAWIGNIASRFNVPRSQHSASLICQNIQRDLQVGNCLLELGIILWGTNLVPQAG
jgi:hypothetical protein